MEGVLPVCKPPGMTSHDVVAAVRRITGQRHTGHAGTLDPAAAGVLVVLIGRSAARLTEYLLEFSKTYIAEVRFGRTMDSQDFTGTTVGECPRGSAGSLSRSQVEAVLPGFEGEMLQLPPMVSAVQVDGERLYRLAREGRTVERRPRPIFIHELDLIEFRPAHADGELPAARIRVTCSKGTYVRTLAADIGEALGLGAHLGFLVREAVGPFRLESSFTLEEVRWAAGQGSLPGLMRSPAEALSHLPGVSPEPEELERVRHGAAVPVRRAQESRREGGLVRVLGPDGRLVAVAAVEEGCLRPVKVFEADGGRES